MWDNLSSGVTFDVILVLTADLQQLDLLRGHFHRENGWNRAFQHRPVHFASLDELGRPWRGGNFDASLVGIQRVRRLLRQEGIPDESGKSLVVLASGQGKRAYPLTAAEGGNKCMIRTPAQLNRRSLRLIELVIAQYHQILDDVEPGRIHIAAGDHLLAWDRPPCAAGRQHLQISASTVSFRDEAERAGLLDGVGSPRWSDSEELDRRLAGLRFQTDLPVLHSLTQLGLLRASREEENLLYLVEKAGVAHILRSFAGSAGEARINWWDWCATPDAAHLLLNHYGDLIGTGIDFSTDFLEPLTLSREDWLRRRPDRKPQLWDRANALFENPTLPGWRPLGRVGVGDPGRGSVFEDLGTLPGLHAAFSRVLSNTEDGERRRNLLGARLEDGVLFVGERPGPRVEVEPGSIVIDGAGIRSGHVGAGSLVVDARVGEIRTSGRCIVYGVRAPRRTFQVTDGGVAADVVRGSRRRTVRGSLFGPSRPEGRSRPEAIPCHPVAGGAPTSPSDSRASPEAGIARGPVRTGRWSVDPKKSPSPWKGRSREDQRSSS
jgi:hypothetical protein